jgi:DivIVA domain-containing protein
MSDMDSSQSALDSLRTVEFRETLKGYHRDDVDEYLERAAIEAEGLQEQLRQSGERLRQAAERIAELETETEHRPEPEVAVAAEPSVPDDRLQRTLLLAQKFVDETKADSEAHAAQILAEADAKARLVTEQAEAKAAQVAAESEQRLREEIGRLEGTRSKLSHEVEAMSRHLESERNRLRTTLGDILKWVDDNIRPVSSGIDLRGRGESPSGPSAPAPARTEQPATAASGANRPAEAGARAASARSGPTGAASESQPGGVITRTATTEAPLPL